MSYLNWPVSQIAVEISGSAALFFRHKINFCYEGSKCLSEVLERENIDQQSIVDELLTLEKNNTKALDFDSQSNQEIIDYILQRYHETHKKQLAELQKLAIQVEVTHADHPLCPVGLVQHLANMEAELLLHMQKEESILFPLLAKGFNPVVNAPIQVMRSEHEKHLEQINRIYQLTNSVIPHDDACDTWRALYLGLQEFISDLNLHIHIENNVLFNRANA